MIKRLVSFFLIFEVCVASSDVPEFHKLGVAAFYEKFHIPSEARMELLRGGMSTSVIYKLESYVVRLLFPKVCQAQRVEELNLHEECSARGIAPKIVYVDDKSNPYVIVMDRIESRNFDPILDSLDVQIMSQIATSMKIIHKSQIRPAFNKSLIDQIRNFRYEATRFPSCFKKLRSDLLAEAGTYEHDQVVPVHGELSRWNITRL